MKPFAKGEVVELNKVNDAVFLTGVMGNGFAIVPTEGKVLHHSQVRLQWFSKLSTLLDYEVIMV